MTPLHPRARLRLPAFHPVPVLARAPMGGPVRQAEFIGILAQTGSVSAAPAFVGCSRETAYRLRRKPGAEEFARAWDVALVIAGVLPVRSHEGRAGAVTGRARKVTSPPTSRRVVDGLWRPVVRRWTYVGSVHKPDNGALVGYMAQLDRGFRAERKEARAKLRSQTQKGGGASTAAGDLGFGRNRANEGR